jgi:hypothetical protein
MKNQEDFLFLQQRSGNEGKPQKRNSFHFNDFSWEVEGEKVRKNKIIKNL